MIQKNPMKREIGLSSYSSSREPQLHLHSISSDFLHPQQPAAFIFTRTLAIFTRTLLPLLLAGRGNPSPIGEDDTRETRERDASGQGDERENFRLPSLFFRLLLRWKHCSRYSSAPPTSAGSNRLPSLCFHLLLRWKHWWQLDCSSTQSRYLLPGLGKTVSVIALIQMQKFLLTQKSVDLDNDNDKVLNQIRDKWKRQGQMEDRRWTNGSARDKWTNQIIVNQHV
ncbi:hypothetical protein LXL04_036035 [Taraxacum kok-saghyz]